MRNVPEWTKGNAFAKRFFKWLRKKNNPALLTWENVFTKTFNREFTFVYMGTNLENRASHLYQGMECLVFRCPLFYGTGKGKSFFGARGEDCIPK